MLIRQATDEDVSILTELIARSVRILSADSYTTRQIEGALINVFGVDTQLIRDGTYYVAEIEGQIAGCGGWSKRKSLFGGDQTKTLGADSELNPKTDPARVRAFFVDPAFTRRGIGSRILETCEAAAREGGFTVFELAATLPGEPLYAAFGYVVVDRFEIALPDGEFLPVARMRKEVAR